VPSAKQVVDPLPLLHEAKESSFEPYFKKLYSSLTVQLLVSVCSITNAEEKTIQCATG